MKLNWGTGMALLYGGFVVVVLGLAAFTMTKKVDLVTDNYYDKELKYEEQIQKEKNTGSLNLKPEVEIFKDSLKVIFPESFNSDSTTGALHFYRPSDSDKDAEFQLKLKSNNMQVINTSAFEKGSWKVKINWSYSGTDYYLEKSFFIQ